MLTLSPLSHSITNHGGALKRLAEQLGSGALDFTDVVLEHRTILSSLFSKNAMTFSLSLFAPTAVLMPYLNHIAQVVHLALLSIAVWTALGVPYSVIFVSSTVISATHSIAFRSVTPICRLSPLTNPIIMQRWNGDHFTKITLKHLGLRIQLGHQPGEKCALPTRATNDDFVVLDTHGVHEVGLDFCGCQTAEPTTVQLLRIRWFPATTRQPKSAATFRLLKHFQLQNFESKESTWEFYRAISRKTDNVTAVPQKVFFTLPTQAGLY
jgi:hypothetical protein